MKHERLPSLKALSRLFSPNTITIILDHMAGNSINSVTWLNFSPEELQHIVKSRTFRTGLTMGYTVNLLLNYRQYAPIQISSKILKICTEMVSSLPTT